MNIFIHCIHSENIFFLRFITTYCNKSTSTLKKVNILVHKGKFLNSKLYLIMSKRVLLGKVIVCSVVLEMV